MFQTKEFLNELFGTLTILVDENDDIWFVGKEVANVLGYQNPAEAIQDHTVYNDRKALRYKEIEKPIRKKIWKNPNDFTVKILINQSGLLTLISTAQTISESKKEEILSWLKEKNLLPENTIVIKSRSEIEFVSKLQRILKGMKINSIPQFSVGNYRIDLYLPDMKIAIEYDENEHRNYDAQKEYERQLFIEKSLGCSFVRIPNCFDDEYAIGLVLREVVKVA